MPAVLVALTTKLSALGPGAKAVVAGAVATVTLAVAGGAVALLGAPGSASDAAALSHVPSHITDVGGPPADGGGAVVPEIPAGAASEAAGVPAETGAAPTPLSATGEGSAPAGVSPPPQPAAAPAPAPAPAPPAGVPRRTPSAAEVGQAIEALPRYIKTVVPPTPGLVAEVGRQVCTAFDQGYSFAEVKETGLRMLTQLPRTTVYPGGADWAVRSVVALYCPGHAPKLV